MAKETLTAELQQLKLQVAELERKLQQLQPDRCIYGPPVDSVPMAKTRVVMHQIVLPALTDVLGICFGGQVLSWIDVCAGMSARTLAKGPCVTASVDAVHFLRPCRLGTVVIVAAMVNRTFTSSMEVGVRVEAEDMRTGTRHHCCSAYLTFVVLSCKPHPTNAAQGTKPVLPRVMPTTAEHQRIYEEAEGRRSARLAQRAKLRSDPQLAAAQDLCRLQPITHHDGCPTLPPTIEIEPNGTGLPQRQQVTPNLTTAYMTQYILPSHANTLGITFGGQVLSWIEQCSYISASRLRGPHTLTASMDSVAFTRPTQVGDIMYITSQVTAIFGSSLEVMVSVHGEDPQVGDIFHCADAYVTVVMVDDDVNPYPLPFELVPQTATEKLRFEGALQRREERLRMRQQLIEDDSSRPSLDGGLPELRLARKASGVDSPKIPDPF